RGRALRGAVDGVQRLAGGHEQPVALGPAEADVAARLRQPDPPDELALRVPHRHPAVAERAPAVARDPEVAVDVGAHAVRPALDAVDHEVGEELLIRQLVSLPTSNTCMSRLPPGPVSPGPRPVLMT